MSNIIIAVWNANGMHQHIHEIKAFIADQNIDIMLISETHLTEKSFVRIPNYTIYNTNHPAKTARGGSAIIIRNSIAHCNNPNYCQAHLQATSVTIQDSVGKLTIAALYCPPRYSIKEDQFSQFYKTLGIRFIAAGDYNAKHTLWGSRIISPKGRELFKVMLKMNLSHISTGTPTYWPTDKNKIPDVIDFCITKGLSSHLTKAVSSFDLSSDHSPILVSLFSQVKVFEQSACLHNKNTVWTHFKTTIRENLNLKCSLRNPADIENAIDYFNSTVQQAAWNSTPLSKTNDARSLSREVKEKIKEKRQIRKRWQATRDPNTKTLLNRASKELKSTLQEIEDQNLAKYLQSLSATEATNYSLWKATNNTYQQTPHSSPLKMNNGCWAKTDSEIAAEFSRHLAEVFKPHPRQASISDDSNIIAETDESSYQQCSAKSSPIRKSEVLKEIQNLKLKKAAGYDLISPKVLKELPSEGICLITYIFNAILRLFYFPMQWKTAQVQLILKPGKPAELASSYRPISLLPILSKILEKLLLKRILPVIDEYNLIPDHQFGFRRKHSTVEQVNRVYSTARKAIEDGEYCTAVFLDVSQAFDKVWHPGLLYKIKRLFPLEIYKLLYSYLANRYFFVKVKQEITNIVEISSGVPQGSVLGPILYTIFTSDLPLSGETCTATFADDTVIMSVSKNAEIASNKLQRHLGSLEEWLKLWRIQVNETKSTHITFTLKKSQCPTVYLNSTPIPQANEVKYLGIHMEKRLTWHSHIWTKRKQLGLKLRSMYWLLCNTSKLSLENKLLIYKVMLKPVWTYGIQLWGTAAISNIIILQRFQSKILRIITNAPYYISNSRIHQDLGIPTVLDEIKAYSSKYIARLQQHPNVLAANLISLNENRRLHRCYPTDLPARFL